MKGLDIYYIDQIPVPFYDWGDCEEIAALLLYKNYSCRGNF